MKGRCAVVRSDAGGLRGEDVAPFPPGAPLRRGGVAEARKKTWGPGRNSYLVPSPHIFFRLWARKRAPKVVGVPPIRGT